MQETVFEATVAEEQEESLVTRHDQPTSVVLRRRLSLLVLACVVGLVAAAATARGRSPPGSMGAATGLQEVTECSAAGANCLDTRCCFDEGFKCFKKNKWWAACNESCTRGINANEPKEHQQPWSCKVLGHGPKKTVGGHDPAADLAAVIEPLKACLSEDLALDLIEGMLYPSSNTAPPERVVYMGDGDWEQSKRLHNNRVSGQVNPAAVVFATSEAEVAHAAACARKVRLPLEARSGGHSYEAFCDLHAPCVLVDVSSMKRVSVDKRAKEGLLGAGLNNGEMYRELNKHGFTLPGGTCHTVGLGGLTLGGGKGRLARLHGMMIDHLRAADIVLLDGSLVHANATQLPDLFWLARGGGGNIFPGVVTSFYFNLVPAPDVVSFVMRWDISEAEKVMEHFQTELATHKDNRLHVRLVLNCFGSMMVKLDGVFAGASLAETKKIMSSIEHVVGKAKESTVEERSWIQAVMAGSGVSDESELGLDFKGWDSGYDTSYKYRSLMFEKLPPKGVKALVEWAASAPNAETGFYLQIDPIGGAAGDVAPNETAFPWRSPSWMVLQVSSRWEGQLQDMEEHHKETAFHVFSLVQALQPHLTSHAAYVNYMDKHPGFKHSPLNRYWGVNAPRMQNVSAKYSALAFDKEWEMRSAPDSEDKCGDFKACALGDNTKGWVLDSFK